MRSNVYFMVSSNWLAENSFSIGDFSIHDVTKGDLIIQENLDYSTMANYKY